MIIQIPVENALKHAFVGMERSEEHTSELQSRFDLVCRLLLEKKNKNNTHDNASIREVQCYYV
mgnify:CR=1 FL=1